jgi:surface antigen
MSRFFQRGAHVGVALLATVACSDSATSPKGGAGSNPGLFSEMGSMTVTLADSTLKVGQNTQATVTRYEGLSGTPPSTKVDWSSSDASVATVSDSGLVAAISPGSVVITGTSHSYTASAPLTVILTDSPPGTDSTATPPPDSTTPPPPDSTPPPPDSTSPPPPPPPPAPASVASVTIAPQSSTLEIGQTQLLTVTVRDSTGNILTGRTVSWASSAAIVAAVDLGGLVTGLLAGTTTISATADGVTGSASVTVVAPVVPPPGSQPEPGLGDVVLFQDNFDLRSDFSGYGTRGALSLVAGRGALGKAARFSYSPTSNDNLIEKAFAASGDIYVRYWYRITPSGATPYAGRTGSGLKWFMAWRAVAARYTCGTSTLNVASTTPGYPSADWEFGCHDNSSASMPNPFGQNIAKTPRFNTTNDGNWHEYTLHIVTGSGGYEQIWIDGVKVMDTYGLGYDHSSEGISMIQFPGLVVDGIPDSSWNFAVDVDDFAIWHK